MISIPLRKSQAVQRALCGDWNEAIDLNQELLKEVPGDIETLNRLAFAQAVIGKTKAARLTYQKVLHLDSQNPIALKNLKKLKGSSYQKFGKTHIMPKDTESMFLEESGKTKVIELINIADQKVTSHLTNGEILNLAVKRLKIFILDSKNAYVGMLPDDVGKRLIKFIKGGNTYEAYIKTVDKNKVTIFIRETKRSTRFKNLPSFSLGEKTKAAFPTKGYKSELEETEPAEEEE